MTAVASDTRRCLLPADGGCGKVWPGREFQARFVDGRWADRYHDLCAECRDGVTVESRAREHYEAGAAAESVAAMMAGRGARYAYKCATRYGWSRVARREAQAELRRKSCEKLSHQCIADGCYRPRTQDSEQCAGHLTRSQERASRNRSPAAVVRMHRVPVSRALVTVRCHVCSLYRTTSLDAPAPCPRCGTSGAVPVGVWDEVADEVAA